MGLSLEFILVLLGLTNIYVLGAARIGNLIKVIMVQGVLLAFFTVYTHIDHLAQHVMILAAVVLAVKGVLIPWLLLRTSKELRASSNLEPYVGFTFSMVLGVVFIWAAFLVTKKMTLLPSFPDFAVFTIPLATATLFSGFLVIVGRREALTQAIGYLVIENAVFIYGISLSAGIPLMVEIGIMLDVLGSVMIMGIALFHINKTFDHIDPHAVPWLDEIKD